MIASWRSKHSNSLVKRFFKNTRDVEGWLTWEDAEIMSSVLLWQQRNEFRGNILEIGAYRGKSAYLIATCMPSEKVNHETLFLVDIFSDMDLGRDNAREIHYSYGDRNMESLTKLLNSANESLEVQCIDSSSEELHSILAKTFFRFIHIDGSHLYEIVIKDIEFAYHHVDETFGIIAVDDFRSIHAPGVSRAVWVSLEKFNLKIVLISPGKIYLARNSFVFTMQDILNVDGGKKINLNFSFDESGGVPFIQSPFNQIYVVGFKRSLLSFLGKFHLKLL